MIFELLVVAKSLWHEENIGIMQLLLERISSYK